MLFRISPQRHSCKPASESGGTYHNERSDEGGPRHIQEYDDTTGRGEQSVETCAG